MKKPHKHEFSLLYTYFGPYGDQSVHIHPCIAADGDCDVVRIGPTRACKRSDPHEDRDLDADPIGEKGAVT